MSAPQNSQSPNPLGAFAALVGVLAIFLYFTGWVYRWAYFGSFALELNSLNLPAESFFLVPIQVILGEPIRFLLAILVAIAVIGLISITLWILRSPAFPASPSTGRSPLGRAIARLDRSRWLGGVRRFADIIPQPLRHDLVIVVWLLVALFWFARWQGTTDAFRDAINSTSTRPVVTLISPSDKLALGRNLDDLLTDPSLKGIRVIGDVEQFNAIRGKETTVDPAKPIVWRLLVESENWVYLFSALPEGAKSEQRPLLLAVNSGDGRIQVLILSRPKGRPLFMYY